MAPLSPVNDAAVGLLDGRQARDSLRQTHFQSAIKAVHVRLFRGVPQPKLSLRGAL